jgi:hypothetical protein
VILEKILKWYHPLFVIISPLKKTWPFIWIHLNSLYLRMICTKFDRNWLAGSGEQDFFKKTFFAVISPCRRAFPYIWTNLNNPFYQGWTTGDQKSSLR